MRIRKEVSKTAIDVNGNAIEYKFFDGGLLPEDQVILYMKHYLYQLTTGKSAPMETPGEDFKKLKNYLLRLYVNYK